MSAAATEDRGEEVELQYANGVIRLHHLHPGWLAPDAMEIPLDGRIERWGLQPAKSGETRRVYREATRT